jgi:hypothetical protein
VGGLSAASYAAVELRALLDRNDSDALVKGLALIEPWQRAELRRVLDLADSLCGAEARENRMSLAKNVESALGKIVTKIENGVRDFDGQALADARKLLADASAAEGQVITIAEGVAAQLGTLAAKYGPELAEVGAQLLADLKSLLGTG